MCGQSVHHVACVFGKAYHFVVLFRRQVVEIVIYRVLRHTAQANFVEQVRTSRFSGVADFAEQVDAF